MVSRFAFFIVIAAIFNMNALAGDAYSITDLDRKYGNEWYPFSEMGENGYFIKVHKGSDFYKNICRVKIFKAKKVYRKGEDKFLVIDEGYNDIGYLDGAIFIGSRESCENWRDYSNKIVKIDEDIDDYSMVNAYNFAVNLRTKKGVAFCPESDIRVDRLGLYKIDAASLGYEANLSCMDKMFYVKFVFSGSGGRVISEGPILD